MVTHDPRYASYADRTITSSTAALSRSASKKKLQPTEERPVPKASGFTQPNPGADKAAASRPATG